MPRDPKQQRFDFSGGSGQKPPPPPYEPPPRPPPTRWQRLVAWLSRGWRTPWAWLRDGLKKAPGQIIAGVIGMLAVAAIRSWWFAEPEAAKPAPPPTEKMEPARPVPPAKDPWEPKVERSG